MNRKFWLLLLLILPFSAISQPCSPDTISLDSQYSIDNFVLFYPNCDQIAGALFIEGDDITNLDGLSVLTTIGNELEIANNPVLTGLSGLENLDSIGGDLLLINNDAINDVSGLDNLKSIGGELVIDDNDALTGLSELAALDQIGGKLRITDNDMLLSLEGLHNIDPTSITDLRIQENPLLQACHIESICDYLVSPNGVIDILNNAEGCNSPPEIADICGVTLPCLPFGNYYFKSQQEVDDFTTYYPNCTQINGSLILNGSDISNLDSLGNVTAVSGNLAATSCISLTNLSQPANITSIGGSLYLWDNENLSALPALQEVTSIGGLMWIFENSSLQSLEQLGNLNTIGNDTYIMGDNGFTTLEGLENLTSIEGVLSFQNTNLTSLATLYNLTSIDGPLHIANNAFLENLSGLDGINAASISEIEIYNNPALTTCEVLSICNYLALPGADVNIHNNDNGCNSEDEVEEACTGVSIKENDFGLTCTISPNPCHEIVHLRYEAPAPGYLVCVLYMNDGRKVREVVSENVTPGIYSTELNVSGLSGGIYFLKIQIGNVATVKKLVVYR